MRVRVSFKLLVDREGGIKLVKLPVGTCGYSKATDETDPVAYISGRKKSKFSHYFYFLTLKVIL